MNSETYKNLLYLYALINVNGLGPARILALKSKFGDFYNILNSSKKKLSEVEFINSGLSSKITEVTGNLENIERILNNHLDILTKKGARIITYWSEEYPKYLREIYNSPLILYIMGKIEESDERAIGVVGTRTPTNYGKIITEKFSSELAMEGYTIVSGLARGIDTIAHLSALKSKGRTIAVTGSGIDIIYPRENTDLFYRISEDGAVITEYQPGTGPDAVNFPKRNRIISGMSKGVLLIESTSNGGAMRTAAFALEQNRDVFAIPGNITSPQSEGTNNIIKNSSAFFVTDPSDIINAFGESTKKKEVINVSGLSLFETKIIDSIKDEPKQIDVISNETGISISECSVTLLQLEFNGFVKQLPGKVFGLL